MHLHDSLHLRILKQDSRHKAKDEPEPYMSYKPYRAVDPSTFTPGDHMDHGLHTVKALSWGMISNPTAAVGEWPPLMCPIRSVSYVPGHNATYSLLHCPHKHRQEIDSAMSEVDYIT